MFNDDFPLKSKTILTNKVNNTVGEDGKENQEFLEFLIYEEKSQENHRDDTQHHISCNKREKSDDFFLLSFSHFSSGYSACKKKRRGSGLRYFGNKLWRPTPRSGQSGQSRPKTGPHGSQRVVFLELKKAQRWA